MRRLGLYSGKIYSEKESSMGIIRECTFVIPNSYTDRDIETEHQRFRSRCNTCKKCYCAKSRKRNMLLSGIMFFIYQINQKTSKKKWR